MGMVQQLVALVRTEHSPFHEHVLGALCRCAGRQGTAREGVRVRVRWGTRGLAQEEVRLGARHRCMTPSSQPLLLAHVAPQSSESSLTFRAVADSSLIVNPVQHLAQTGLGHVC